MLAHFWLGAALMLAPVAAWIAVRGEVAWPPVVLGGAVLLWVAGFDIIYACQDFEVDAQLGLHSVPATVGVCPWRCGWRPCAIWGWCCCCSCCRVVFPQLGAIYLAGIVAVAVLLVYEHWLVRPDDLIAGEYGLFPRECRGQPGPAGHRGPGFADLKLLGTTGTCRFAWLQIDPTAGSTPPARKTCL